MLDTLRHRLSGEYEIDDFGLDPELTRIMATAFEPIAEKWFRLQVRGIENVPYDGGALLVANHSGTVPVDGLMTGFAVQKHAGRYMRPLGADLVFALPSVGEIARKMGATLRSEEHTSELQSRGHLVCRLLLEKK